MYSLIYAPDHICYKVCLTMMLLHLVDGIHVRLTGLASEIIKNKSSKPKLLLPEMFFPPNLIFLITSAENLQF